MAYNRVNAYRDPNTFTTAYLEHLVEMYAADFREGRSEFLSTVERSEYFAAKQVLAERKLSP